MPVRNLFLFSNGKASSNWLQLSKLKFQPKIHFWKQCFSPVKINTQYTMMWSLTFVPPANEVAGGNVLSSVSLCLFRGLSTHRVLDLTPDLGPSPSLGPGPLTIEKAHPCPWPYSDTPPALTPDMFKLIHYAVNTSISKHSSEMPSCAMLNCTSVKRTISPNRQCQHSSAYTNIMSALAERQKLQTFWRNIIQESDPAKINVL